MGVDIGSLCPLSLEMSARTAIAFHSNEVGFAANIPSAATKQVNFRRFSHEPRRGSSIVNLFRPLKGRELRNWLSSILSDKIASPPTHCRRMDRANEESR